MSRHAPRVALVVVALFALAWLAVMERDARLLDRGADAVRPGATAAELGRAQDDLEAARLLNPDTRPDQELALLHEARGDSERALATMEDVVRREPDDLVAWGVLAVLARGDDPAVEARAVAAARRLDPVRAPRGRPASP